MSSKIKLEGEIRDPRPHSRQRQWGARKVARTSDGNGKAFTKVSVGEGER